MPEIETVRQHVSAAAAGSIDKWLTEPKYAEYKDELVDLIKNEKWQNLEDAFFKVIEFGTGGRRGIVGVGSNRINRVTIGESTQALCEYAKAHDAEAASRGIVIGCDTRLSSEELSRYAATVAAGSGFKTYIFDGFRSTPEVSFAVRHLKAAAGIVITASHNAPEYNGFKAYWSDGAQLVPPHDSGVLAMAEKIDTINTISNFDEAIGMGNIIIVGDEIDSAYYKAVLAESIGDNHALNIAYSPLHGAGQMNTLPVLQKAGFNVYVEESQMIPDGLFPTMEDGRANPEKPLANKKVVELMLSRNADIAVSNDPDADRLAVIVKQGKEAVYLSGNQTAALVTEYVLRTMSQKSQLSPKHYIAKTIVTTDLLDAIAEKYGVECVGNLHVGFKWICEVISKREPLGGKFITGSEESFGLMKGSYTRDKDGAVALIIAEYAAELKLEGRTLYDRLQELYSEFGLYYERLDTVVCEGASGLNDMKTIMKSLRTTPPLGINGELVTAVLDYSNLTRTEIATGATTSIDSIKGDVFVLQFGDPRKRITIRPSGTEPIMKSYVQWYVDSSNIEKDIENTGRVLAELSVKFEEIAFQRLNI